MEKIKLFLSETVKVAKENPFAALVVIILMLAVGSGSYVAGRYSAPSKVVEVTKEVEVVKEVIKTVEVIKEVESKNKDLAENLKTHKERIEETKPDGTKTVKETVDTNVDRTVKEVEIRYVDKTVEVEKIVEVEKKVEVEKIVEKNKSDWEVLAKVGVDFLKLSNVPFPVTIGLEVDRRILGPLKVGVWVNTETTFHSVTGGLSVGIEF